MDISAAATLALVLLTSLFWYSFFLTEMLGYVFELKSRIEMFDTVLILVSLVSASR